MLQNTYFILWVIGLSRLRFKCLTFHVGILESSRFGHHDICLPKAVAKSVEHRLPLRKVWMERWLHTRKVTSKTPDNLPHWKAFALPIRPPHSVVSFKDSDCCTTNDGILDRILSTLVEMQSCPFKTRTTVISMTAYLVYQDSIVLNAELSFGDWDCNSINRGTYCALEQRRFEFSVILWREVLS